MKPTVKWAAIGVVLLGIIIGFLWFVPEQQVKSFSESNKLAAKDVLVQTNEYRRTWAQIIGGFALLLGLYFTWRRVEISQEQQVTERFTRAIDQLGATDDRGKKKLEIRLGGVYALERIARDSKKDHWPIMETLTTYVREHAPWPPKKHIQETGFIAPPETAQREQQASNTPDDRPDQEIPVPELDIQAILTVLRRRTRYLGNGEVERLDLHETDLRRGNLHRAHLEEANLHRAHLESANLWEAHLERAFLWEAYLDGADLSGAHLEGAQLQEAHLEGAQLKKAHLKGAHLEGAHLEGADLSQEQIDQALGDEFTELPKGRVPPEAWPSEEPGLVNEGE